MKTACPQCGAEIDFRYDDSFVRVCGYCRAAVVRGDRGIESLGRVADLAPLESPLSLFIEGRFQGIGFMLVGRAQIRHGGGGVWQEWYGKFDDGRWGWIAEAQGRVFVTFESAGAGAVPPWGQLAPSMQLALLDGAWRTYMVAERGEARYLAAEGEIPYRFQPGGAFLFADLSDGHGHVATLDYGDRADEPPSIYLGREVVYGDLALVSGGAVPAPAPRIASRHLACPQCGGSIELRAPDATQRVACPYCAAFLDASQGDLRLLGRLGKPLSKPAIPLGTRGTFDGEELTVIGTIHRAAIIHGRWPFFEYLLYSPKVGFRWLVESDGHWTFVRPLAVGAVIERADGEVTYDGVPLRRFQACPLVVDAVYGEMYWKVEVGEQVFGTDWVAPPAMVSKEETDSEVTWSLGEYMTADDVKERLGLAELPTRPVGIAPNQPFRHAGVGRVFGWLLLAVLAAASVLLVIADNRVVLDERFEVVDTRTSSSAQPPPGVGAAGEQVFFSRPFDLAGGQNVEIRLHSGIRNTWLYVVGDLVNEATGELESFDRSIEYYFGTDGGESWTEGSTTTTVHIGAPAAGRYLVRVEAQREPGGGAHALTVQVRQGVFRGGHLVAALVALGLPALFILLWWWWFERRRWRDSDHAPWYARQGESDDD
jgi:hypothetical protein